MTVTDLAMTRKANKLRKDLLDNLTARGLVESAFADQVEEYINLWIIKEQLNRDIMTRGAVIPDGVSSFKENPCITKRIQISQQMGKIFKALGFENAAVAAKLVGEDDVL